jgi:hypothetical protein
VDPLKVNALFKKKDVTGKGEEKEEDTNEIGEEEEIEEEALEKEKKVAPPTVLVPHAHQYETCVKHLH